MKMAKPLMSIQKLQDLKDRGSFHLGRVHMNRKTDSIMRYLMPLLLLPLFNGNQQESNDSQIEELFDPVALYLTWQYDPATSMTIDWHVTGEDTERPVILH